MIRALADPKFRRTKSSATGNYLYLCLPATIISPFHRITFDTGRTVKGICTLETRCSIAKELRIGNITVSDVPFLVTDMATGNDEADL